jgi:hypothetical protein
MTLVSGAVSRCPQPIVGQGSDGHQVTGQHNKSLSRFRQRPASDVGNFLVAVCHRFRVATLRSAAGSIRRAVARSGFNPGALRRRVREHGRTHQPAADVGERFESRLSKASIGVERRVVVATRWRRRRQRDRVPDESQDVHQAHSAHSNIRSSVPGSSNDVIPCYKAFDREGNLGIIK